MATTITTVDVLDIRFPTSRARDGSDAMSPDPDYSAAYVILRTDRPDGVAGPRLTINAGPGHQPCAAAARRAQGGGQIRGGGYHAHTTSAGWLGYPDDKIRRLCREGVARGWSHFKIKVGHDLEDDLRRAAIVRGEIGPDRKLMLDANQVWDVGEAIANMRELARFDPWWIEEPTSPDDVLGHVAIARAIAPIGVATGEQCHNRVMFKQLMQAGAIRFCQIDSRRLGGVNEVLAVVLLAAPLRLPGLPPSRRGGPGRE